jgi:hypothetical protein
VPLSGVTSSLPCEINELRLFLISEITLTFPMNPRALLGVFVGIRTLGSWAKSFSSAASAMLGFGQLVWLVVVDLSVVLHSGIANPPLSYAPQSLRPEGGLPRAIACSKQHNNHNDDDNNRKFHYYYCYYYYYYCLLLLLLLL